MHPHDAWLSSQGIATLVRAIRGAPIEPGMPVPRDPGRRRRRRSRAPQGPIAPKFAGGDAKCAGLAEAFARVAAEERCGFFDAATRHHGEPAGRRPPRRRAARDCSAARSPTRVPRLHAGSARRGGGRSRDARDLRHDQLLALIADPIARARTPGLVNAALAARGCDAALLPLQVAAGGLGDVLPALRATAQLPRRGGQHAAQGGDRAAARRARRPRRRRSAPATRCGASPTAGSSAPCSTARASSPGSRRGDRGRGPELLPSRAPVVRRPRSRSRSASTVLRARRCRTARRRAPRRSRRACARLAGDAHREHGAAAVRRGTTSRERDRARHGRADPPPFDVARLAPTPMVAEVVAAHDETALLRAAAARGCRITRAARAMLVAADRTDPRFPRLSRERGA